MNLRMQRILFPSLLLAAAAAAPAHEPGFYERERTLGAASELLPLCRQEAQAHYIGMGERIYQWTGSYHDYADTLYADGKLRVDGRDVEVHCRIARHARERYMTMEMVDPGK